MDCGNEFGNYYECHSRNFYIVETIGAKGSFRTAVGMSMISMLLMEVAMNVVDYGMMGSRQFTLLFYLLHLGAGFWLLGLTIIGG